MKIRDILPHERLQWDAICTSVFFSDPGRDIRALQANPEPPQESNDIFIGAFDDGDVLLSGFCIHRFVMRMNGQDVRMGGVGGVVTKPESRGRGLIKAIMRSAFERMRDEGIMYSFLYPFSHKYYRKFGYELCAEQNKLCIPISELSRLEYPKHITAHNPGDDAAPYADIYNTFVRRRNLAIVRDAAGWDKMLKRDPYKDRDFTFLHHSDGVADAYVMYQMRRSEHNDVHIKELCCTSPQGLLGILGFLGRLGSEAVNVFWNAPADLGAVANIGECYDISRSAAPGGMLRLHCPLHALNGLQAPQGSGCVVLGIKDDFLPGNSGTYVVEYADGSISVAQPRKYTTPDVITDIQTLAQLVSGFLTPQQAAYKPGTSIPNPDAVAALFPMRSQFITETF